MCKSHKFLFSGALCSPWVFVLFCPVIFACSERKKLIFHGITRITPANFLGEKKLKSDETFLSWESCCGWKQDIGVLLFRHYKRYAPIFKNFMFSMDDNDQKKIHNVISAGNWIWIDRINSNIKNQRTFMLPSTWYRFLLSIDNRTLQCCALTEKQTCLVCV